MNQAPTSEPPAQYSKIEIFLILHQGKLMLASFLIAFVVTAMIMPPSGGIRQTPHSARMQAAFQIGQCLFSYAQDHNGKYPVGKSSTDIFQQLIDQQYVYNPEIFYFAMPGKTKATADKLKPENVCFDVTNGVQADDPDRLPLVISTGYKIDYAQGGKAHLQSNGDPDGIAVFYKGNNGAFLKVESGSVTIVPSKLSSGDNPTDAFDPKGRTYQQLTPDGSVP